jgi:hypothetical protein
LEVPTQVQAAVALATSGKLLLGRRGACGGM